MDIKAIETLYKGYRFRSRLEARWAVFFDALGIEWQYEPEGFDLNGEWYLPDFWLPQSRHLIEVKPKEFGDKRPSKYIYCAGKISKNDWRGLIVDAEDDNRTERKYQPRYDMPSWDTRPIYNSPHKYVGPYYAQGCDHGCTHGNMTHGWNEGEYGCNQESWFIDHCNHSSSTTQQAVHFLCNDAIARCDIFFAWIDTYDCFGTIAEIGYAYSAHSGTCRILLAFPIDFETDDLWFVKQYASGWGHFDSPLSALNAWLPGGLYYKQSSAESKLLKVANHMKAVPYFACGDPMENLSALDIVTNTSNYKLMEQAAMKARSARFEHGEAP